jgi:hypothetical protein
MLPYKTILIFLVDLVNACAYADAYPEEIALAIHENNEVS